MSVSALTSTDTASSAAATPSLGTSGMNTDDFLNLLVGQLKNQNPLDPTDTNQLLNQMVSYASYGQQTDVNTTLSAMNKTLDGISSALALLIQEKTQ